MQLGDPFLERACPASQSNSLDLLLNLIEMGLHLGQQIGTVVMTCLHRGHSLIWPHND